MTQTLSNSEISVGGSKKLSDLVDDIYSTLQNGCAIPQSDAEQFGSSLAKLIQERLAPDQRNRKPTLRMSNLGKPDRKLWYELRGGLPGETFEGHTLLKFLLGDVWEHVLLFLAKQAGHEVTHEQAECKLDGIVGHIDAIIDGTVVDVKSASTYAFKKFKDGTLADDDPFGYVEQISGYATAFDTDGAFLAGDKQNGHLALHRVSKEEIKALDIEGRIEHIKKVVASDEIPDRCYEEVEMGQSGNLKLATGCSYCPFKFHCWSDANNGVGLRTFIYSSGPVHMTKVVVEPKVMEATF